MTPSPQPSTMKDPTTPHHRHQTTNHDASHRPSRPCCFQLLLRLLHDVSSVGGSALRYSALDGHPRRMCRHRELRHDHAAGGDGHSGQCGVVDHAHCHLRSVRLDRNRDSHHPSLAPALSKARESRSARGVELEINTTNINMCLVI